MKSAYRKGVRLSITIAPKASAMLDHLLATGLFGRSRAELAQRMIYKGLRDELGPDGSLRWPSTTRNSNAGIVGRRGQK